MNTQLYPFQLEGVDAIDRFGGRALLGDEMGLGKSLQALTWMSENKSALPAVVVCPASLKYHWQREASVHVGMNALVLESRKVPRDMKLPPGTELVIVNYDILGAWLKWLKKIRPQLVVADEIHYAKNHRAKRSRWLRSLSEVAPYFLGISGTPLLNRPAELWHPLNLVRPDLFPSFFSFAMQHCLPEDAPILMSSLREKPISEIRIGDHVIGWNRPEGRSQRRMAKAKVLDIIVKKSTLQKVTLEDGTEIICTPDHKWATGYSTGHDNEYMEARTGRFGGQGRGCASKIMKVFRGTSPLYPIADDDYALGYIHGFFRGDGYCSKEQILRTHPFKNRTRWMKTNYGVGCACEDPQAIDRIESFLKRFGIRYSRTVRSDGLHAIGGISRKECYEFLTKGSVRDSDAWWAGFLGGIYDAEGSGMCIAQKVKVNPITHSMIPVALKRFGFKIKIRDDHISFRGGRKEFLRFWNIANPTLRRKLRKLIMSAGGRLGRGVGESNPGEKDHKVPYVIKIEKLPGIHTVYTLTTETGNYVAYGCGSKNCRPEKNQWGWTFNGAERLDELHERMLAWLLIRRKKADVLPQLPAKSQHVVPVGMSGRKEYEYAVQDFLGWLRTKKKGNLWRAARAESLVKVGYLKRLAARLKLPAVTEWVDNYLEETDAKIILFGIHKDVLGPLKERYEARSVLVDGSVTGKHRQESVDQFNHDPRTRIFLGNIQAAGTGWSASDCSTVGFVELDWTPGNMTQCEDRTHGIGRGAAGRTSTAYYLVAKDSIEEKLCELLQKKQKVLSEVLDGEAGGSGKGELDLHDLLIEKLLED